MVESNLRWFLRELLQVLNRLAHFHIITERLGFATARVLRVFGFFRPTRGELNSAVKQELVKRRRREYYAAAQPLTDCEEIIARAIDEAGMGKDPKTLEILQRLVAEAKDVETMQMLARAIVRAKLED